LKEWTTPDPRNTPSTTNLEEEEIVDAPGNDGNASMPEQIKRPNPWRKTMMISQYQQIIHCVGKASGIEVVSAFILRIVISWWINLLFFIRK